MIDINTINQTVFEVMRGQGIPIKHDYYCVKSKKAEIALSRILLMYFARLEGHTFKSIGRYCGGRDHSTVIHACDTIEDLLDVDKDMRKYVKLIETKLAHSNNSPERKVNNILRLFEKKQLSRLEALTLIMQ